MAERDGAVVLAEQLRTLENEEIFSGRAIIDRIGHLGDDLVAQIRSECP